MMLLYLFCINMADFPYIMFFYWWCKMYNWKKKQRFIDDAEEKWQWHPCLHCFIHQGILCRITVELNDVMMKDITIIVNLLRNANRTQSHWKLVKFIYQNSVQFKNIQVKFLRYYVPEERIIFICNFNSKNNFDIG